MILRQAGIPARYVVGYAVPEQTVAAGEISGNDDSGKPIHDITIIDKQAHAWAEIYEDGWGWRPVDFTPGFMPQVKNKNNGQGKNNSQNVDKPEQQNQNNPTENKPKPDKPENKITPPVQNDENSLPQRHMPAGILFAAAAIGTALLWRRKCHKLLSNRFLNDITMQNQSERTSELYIYMEKEYFNIILNNVKITSITADLYPGASTGTHLETILLRYESITWKHCDGNIIYTDAWNQRVVA